jgi:chromate transporter
VPDHGVPLAAAVRVWVRVALQSFGGPAGQIAVMHRILVEERRWISERRFLHALNYCMLLPGPEAQQLATYIGWLLHRTRGGLIAGGLFILPGFVAILVLSLVYAQYREALFLEAIFFGIKAAVLAVVVEAVFRIGRRALRTWLMVMVAAAAFVAIFFFALPFPVIVLAAGLAGYLGGRITPHLFVDAHASTSESEQSYAITDEIAATTRPSVGASLRTLALWSLLWLVPLLTLWAVAGGASVFTQIATFFSTAALVTFGGAYAVLAYVAQQAVETYAWLEPGEMLDGLGMAETTPGPLIQVVQFVGFLGAARFSDGMHPLVAGSIGAVLTTWVTFVPCFLWIFLGAPYIEHLRSNRGLANALSGITAAVVGVILNLAVWFGLHVMFERVDEVHAQGLRLHLPDWPTLNLASLVLTVVAFAALFWLRLGMLRTLGVCAALGAIQQRIVGVHNGVTGLGGMDGEAQDAAHASSEANSSSTRARTSKNQPYDSTGTSGGATSSAVPVRAGHARSGIASRWEISAPVQPHRARGRTRGASPVEAGPRRRQNEARHA